MIKSISISLLLLMSAFSAYGQTVNGTVIDTTNPAVRPDTSVITTPADITTDINGTTLTPTTPVTTTPIITTPDTTTVTTTPVVTPTTPVITTTPNNSATIVTVPVTSSTTTTPVTSLVCVGTNPTWNLSISKNLISYNSITDPNVKLKAVTPISPVGDSTGNLQVYTTEGSKTSAIILVKRNTNGCTSGLLGRNYQYDTFVVFPDHVVTGCCNPV
jgi:uncharacterized membrane protein